MRAFWIGLPTLGSIDDDNSSRARITTSSRKKYGRFSTVLMPYIIVSDGYVRSWLWKAAITVLSQCSASTNYMGFIVELFRKRWLSHKHTIDSTTKTESYHLLLDRIKNKDAECRPWDCLLLSRWLTDALYAVCDPSAILPSAIFHHAGTNKTYLL